MAINDSPQHFLITVQRMCTSPEADLVSQWSAVVAEENLSRIALTGAAKLTALSLENSPIKDVRPMTEAEIDAWREADRGDGQNVSHLA